jgi:lantibiotic modifying enzyme
MNHYKTINQQIKNLSVKNNSRLFEGSTGVSLFLYELGKKTNCQMTIDRADSYLEEAIDCNKQSRLEFSTGLSGIGWGVDLLLSKGYIDGDRNDVLADIDDKLFQLIAFSTPSKINLAQGLLGYGVLLPAAH